MSAALKVGETVEARSTRRPRTLLTGKIVYGADSLTLDCTIRNLTEQGASLVLPDGAWAPQNFYLLELRNGMCHECETAWRKAPRVGVKIVRSFSVAEQRADTAETRLLHRLWASAGPCRGS